MTVMTQQKDGTQSIYSYNLHTTVWTITDGYFFLLSLNERVVKHRKKTGKKRWGGGIFLYFFLKVPIP